MKASKLTDHDRAVLRMEYGKKYKKIATEEGNAPARNQAFLDCIHSKSADLRVIIYQAFQDCDLHCDINATSKPERYNPFTISPLTKWDDLSFEPYKETDIPALLTKSPPEAQEYDLACFLDNQQRASFYGIMCKLKDQWVPVCDHTRAITFKEEAVAKKFLRALKRKTKKSKV